MSKCRTGYVSVIELHSYSILGVLLLLFPNGIYNFSNIDCSHLYLRICSLLYITYMLIISKPAAVQAFADLKYLLFFGAKIDYFHCGIPKWKYNFFYNRTTYISIFQHLNDLLAMETY
jgi:hypothetical protein